MSSALAIVNKLKCTCKTPIYISPQILRNYQRFDDYKEKQYENFVPNEFFNDDNLILGDNIFPDSEKQILPSTWYVKIKTNDIEKEYYTQKLIENGFCNEEANYTIDSTIDKVQGALEWSKRNEANGIKAARYSIASLGIGVAKSFFENIESAPSILKTALNVVHGFTQGQRSLLQYGLYNHEDDDRGVASYQKEHYGNKITGELAELSCNFETKIKPYVLPFLGFLGNEKRDCLNSMLTLPSTLWWRIRYAGYINQKFASTLLSYPFNLFSNKDEKAKEQFEQDSNIIASHYLKQRLKTLLELKEGEKVSSKVYSLISNLFSDDTGKIEEASGVLNETMAPLLGIAGFAFSAISIPLKTLSTFLPGANYHTIGSRMLDSFSSWGLATQNLLYSLRFSTREYVESKKIKELLENKNIPEKKKLELEQLSNEKHRLAVTGLVGNLLNIFLPIVKLVDAVNPFHKIIKSAIYESANGLSQYFFSQRRGLKGKIFRVNNNKLFEEKQSKEGVENLIRQRTPVQGLRIYTEE